MNPLTPPCVRLCQVIMVCISDGRANVPLSVSNGEPVSHAFGANHCFLFRVTSCIGLPGLLLDEF